jgi:hypothetical protein
MCRVRRQFCAPQSTSSRPQQTRNLPRGAEVNKTCAPVDLCRAVLLVHITRRRAAVARSLPFRTHGRPLSTQQYQWLTTAHWEPPVRSTKFLQGCDVQQATERVLHAARRSRVQLAHHWRSGPALQLYLPLAVSSVGVHGHFVKLLEAQR